MQGISMFVGVDVSKNFFDVDSSSREVQGRFDSTPEGSSRFLEALPKPKTFLIVIEATGAYQRALVADLVTAGHLVSVVNPRQIRDFAKANGILAKTDRIDAAVIARFGRDVKPRPLAETNEKQGELEELAARRRQLIQLRTSEKNRQGTTVRHVEVDPQRPATGLGTTLVRQRTQSRGSFQCSRIGSSRADVQCRRQSTDWHRRLAHHVFHESARLRRESSRPSVPANTLILWPPGAEQFYSWGRAAIGEPHSWMHVEGTWVNQQVKKNRLATNTPMTLDDESIDLAAR